MSKRSRFALYTTLKWLVSDVRITMVNQPSDLEKITTRKPELVFLGMKYIPTNYGPDKHNTHKIWVGDYLTAHNISHTGSPSFAHELEHNKALAKKRIQEFGLATSPFMVVRRGEVLSPQDIPLSFPLFVKPIDRGGGQGIDSTSVCRDFDALTRKITSLDHIHHADALIEEYLPGREFSVAILKNENDSSYLTLPLEIIAPKDRSGTQVQSAEIKKSNIEKALPLEKGELHHRITSLALDCFHAIGGQDYGRIDIRLDADGNPNFLEANLIPSLIENYGNFPKACSMLLGLSYEEMILRLIRLALSR